MEICLIAPARGAGGGATEDRQTPLFPPLGLMTVAALTPEPHHVTIVDEALGPVDPDLSPDLVGLTATTAQAPRAYELADHFRRRGVPVVMGGMHASALPREALLHANAVVVGEAEELWPRVLDDAGRCRLKPLYQLAHRADAAQIPAARRDLLDLSKYVAGNTLQASRGCPFACSFCAVPTFFGGTYRTRPIERVVQEVMTMGSGPLLFIDDNLMGKPTYARELFAAIGDLGRSFVAAASTTVARWPALIQQAARAGCRALFVGLESISQQRLAGLGKRFNVVSKYRELVQRLHDNGVSVIGSFMFGVDGDGPDVFDRTVEFAREAQIDFAQFSIATPLPGTRLYAELAREGRIRVRDWGRYDGSHCVFEPRGMRPDELEGGLRRAYRRFYLSGSMARRLLRRHDGILSLMRKEYFRRIRNWVSATG